MSFATTDTLNLKAPRDVLYAFYEVDPVDGHLVVPMSDPLVYESPFDYLFDTESEALEFLHDYFEEDEDMIRDTGADEWVLAKVTKHVYKNLDISAHLR